MENQLMERDNKFENVLRTAIKLPGIKINRASFLRKELNKFCDDETIKKAVETNPAQAGINVKIINNIAKSCIAYETTKVTAISTAAGIPGGLAVIGTAPADLAQYFGHILRIMQKLVYLYGWQEFVDDNNDKNDFDDGMMNQIVLFSGVMFGVDGVNVVIDKIAKAIAKNVSKKVMEKAFKKGVIYSVVKKVGAKIGVKMSPQVVLKGVGKVIPVLGAVVSGGITAAGFLPMSHRLRKYLSRLPIADVDNYKQTHDSNVIDIDFSDIDIDNIGAAEETEDV